MNYEVIRVGYNERTMLCPYCVKGCISQIIFDKAGRTVKVEKHHCLHCEGTGWKHVDQKHRDN